ncbi:hypothetical protein ACFY8B_30455 [Streptomyces sp. NPDC012751]|uniref:hypothetical protein n=1 Tax=Streptomyces sp. NPDC012751 TaxID=3364846 RepID=UPI0036A2FEC6
MKLSVLLHHRGFPSGAGFQKCDLARYFRLTERRFPGMPVARYLQPVLKPVTKAIGERTRLDVFTFPVFAFLIFSVAGLRRTGNSCFPQRGFRGNRPANSWEFHRRLRRGLRGSSRGLGVDAIEVGDFHRPVGDIASDREIDELSDAGIAAAGVVHVTGHCCRSLG